MIEQDDLEGLTPEEKLHADSELLKLKLELEFGMQGMATLPDLDDKMQNAFLNHVYNWEKQHAESEQKAVYEIIEKPAFKKEDELSDDEVAVELDRINAILAQKGIELEILAKYDNRTIYKFITEELFDCETDDMQMPGMVNTFIYEEFHPNHAYDIEETGNDFIEYVITKKWNEFSDINLADTVEYNGIAYAKNIFTGIIYAFQEAQSQMNVLSWEIKTLNFDLENEIGQVDGFIKYESVTTNETHDGDVVLGFVFRSNFWSIDKVVLPGFGI